MQTILLLCLIASPSNDEVNSERFADVQIGAPYRTYLLADPLLMRVTGAKVIKLDKGRHMIIVVASTVPESDSPRHRLRAERVCRIKALAYIVARNNPVQVVHAEQATDRIVIRIEDGHERAKSVSEVTETIRTRVAGSTHELPVVGRWMSRDRSTLYLAVGVIMDRTGKPVSDSCLNLPDPRSAEVTRAVSR